MVYVALLPDQALWVSHRGTAMGDQALYDLVPVNMRRAFGRTLSPHLFRDCAATGLAIEDATHVGADTPLLGHRSHATLERHYKSGRVGGGCSRMVSDPGPPAETDAVFRAW